MNPERRPPHGGRRRWLGRLFACCERQYCLHYIHSITEAQIIEGHEVLANDKVKTED